MRFLSAFLLLISFFSYSQNYEDRWVGHFSYISVKDISESNNKLYVAAENAVFIYDLNTQGIKTLSTIQGLSGDFITSIHYYADRQLMIIGYENGMIDIYKEEENKVLKVVDIVEKQTIPPDRKRINNFHEYKGKLYISTNYGISVYDLNRLEFGDTYFIGDLGSQVEVVQTVVLGPHIFAATVSSGLKRADVEDRNLIDYQNWTTIVTGGFRAMEKLGGELYASNRSNTILRVSPEGSTSAVQNLPSEVQKFRSKNDLLTITTVNSIQVLSPGYIQEAQVNFIDGYESSFFSGLALGQNIYAGTRQDGLLIVPFGSTRSTQILPNGPIRNRPFGLDASPGQLWVSFGETTIDFNPYPLTRYGISQLKDSIWNNTSFEEMKNAVGGEPTNLMKPTINPFRPEEVYMSSFQKGLLKIENGEPVILYDETNSPLERIQLPGGDAGIRIYGAEFDKQGNLWFVQSRTDKGLIRLNSEGQFRKIDLSNLFDNVDEVALTKMAISREGYVFFGGYKNGLLGYDPTNNRFNKIGGNAGGGNLPSTNVRALAVDTQNRLWIGTLRGLRIYHSPASFFESRPPDSQAVIIMEDGVPQELLYQQSITSIKVDGSNNKWIGTASSGVFYLSASGQETLLRFTKDNSPLPTNNVQDIAIDPASGIVYFATTQGLVAYKGTATAPKNNLDLLRAFPNPVRPGFTGKVTIDGLTAQANVKITDIAGNLVYEEVSQGGSIQWDTTAFGKYKVRSGVYLILVTTDDDSETKVAKIMIIR